jgi:23S rRNA (uracil-5-)-methyltransferase RumA
LVTRVNRLGEAIAIIVINGNQLPFEKELIAALSMVQAIYISPNRARTNVIFGEKVRRLYGKNEFTDTIAGLTFKLSPQSFFQVNPVQTEVLYQTALDFCGLKGDETVLDIYCGAGTISLMLARKAKQVLGIEIVEAAIENAKANALYNGIGNADFLCGAAENVLPKLIAEGYRPDIIALDPPRKGAEPAVIAAIAEAAPEKIVYISCNPATQARDAKLLFEAGYHITKCQPVDMFCYTSGVENVILLEREGKA